MLMTIDCPSCMRALSLPEDAAGRKARCNACSNRFVVPSVEELLESTVSRFALDEMERRCGTDADGEPLEGSLPEDDPLLAATAVAQESSLPEADPLLAAAAAGRKAAAGTIVGVTVAAVERKPRSGRDALQNSGLAMERIGGSVAGFVMPDESEPAAVVYDQEVAPTHRRPHLVVRQVGPDGVTLGFASEWLQHDAFRASVPVRSAFDADPDTSTLRARPMVFLNKLHNASVGARSIEVRHECALSHGGVNGPGLLAEMGRMEGIRPPYDRPVIYYARAGAGVPALKCRVQESESVAGQAVCEVLVPCGEVAVAWLAAVNGVCWPDEAKLRAAVERSGASAWGALGLRTRLRLEPWCRFEPGERFLAYVPDPDFTRAEAGLAGVVVTDRRLIHHKFRRLRDVPLHKPLTLHLRRDGTLTRMWVDAGDRRVKMGKMSHARVDGFLEALPDDHLLRIDAPQKVTEEEMQLAG